VWHHIDPVFCEVTYSSDVAIVVLKVSMQLLIYYLWDS